MQIKTTNAISILRFHTFRGIHAQIKTHRPDLDYGLTHRWTGLWGDSPAGPPRHTASDWTRLPPRRKKKRKRTRVKLMIMRENHKTLTEKVSNWQSKDKWQNNRSNYECISSKYNAHLPSEGHSWWVLGTECQLHHLVRGRWWLIMQRTSKDKMAAKDNVARTRLSSCNWIKQGQGRRSQLAGKGQTWWEDKRDGTNIGLKGK